MRSNSPSTGEGLASVTRACSIPALTRPIDCAGYDADGDCASLAAADYAFGIAKNHPFIDGNKRTAFVAMELCLELNGFRLNATDEEALMAMLRLAASESTEGEFASWIRGNLVPI